MTIATFSLPIDIPWQRIAFSKDMMDKVACDRELPLRWRSSVAVFKYEPPEDQQRTDGFIVSYLKVACTITGYQAEGKEIRIRERLNRSGWTYKDLTDRLGDTASKYYACYGAMLEVVVAPHPNERQFTFDNYPYFADFDPKKRELYEVVTETGETMSRSLEDVNVRLGQTTLQSHEVKDKTTLAASLSGSYAGVTLAGSAANESSTTDLSQQGSENIRTSDAAREARETFSHTTQLSQMYHQLNSYHLGTNRAAFFVLPRPHTVQSEHTFVNGPRELEGMQEFMLVVVRPKEMKNFCVEAYLETAHLTGKPIVDWGNTDTQLRFRVDTPDQTRRTNVASSPAQTGYVVDLKTVPPGALGGAFHGDTGGYKITSVTELSGPRPDSSVTSDYTIVVGTEQVTVNGWVEGWYDRKNKQPLSSSLELNATVYLHKRVPTIGGYLPGLMITGRAVCSCDGNFVYNPTDLKTASVVYEKSLPPRETKQIQQRQSMSIGEANQLGADIKRELLTSLSSADRYPRGTVGLLDSQLFADMMGTHIRHAERDVNPRLLDWAGIDKKLARRVTTYAPSITRSQMLEMPLAQQVENFGLTFAEVVALRRSLTDIGEPKGPPPVPERLQTEIPLLIGLQSYEAQAVLAAAGLIVGSRTVIDSPLPSNTVIAQAPKSGVAVERATEVSIQLASGPSVRLPEVIGLPFSEAACLLREAGLRSEPAVEGRPGSDALVAALDPKAGTLVTPNTPVIIALKRRPKG